MLILTYSNNYGTVSFYGGGSHSFLITEKNGFSLIEKDCHNLTYAGVDGQETISKRALPRSITLSVDVVGYSASELLRSAMSVLDKEGYLYISDNGYERRIYCDNTYISEPETRLRGRIGSFVVQFTCNNPYFEDKEERTAVIYGRAKNITTPFTLPRAFAVLNQGATVTNIGDKEIEPKIIIKCNETLTTMTTISIAVSHNEDTQSLIINNYVPFKNDIITVDIKNRSVYSEKRGNLINNLSDDSFLEKFVLLPGDNFITAEISDITTDIGVDCIYSNLYNKAVII